MQYWFWRLYVPIVWLWVAIDVARWLFTLDKTYLGYVFGAFPLYALAVVAWCNAYVFPFDFCVFGKYRRTPLPDEEPLRTIGKSWGASGRANMGSAVWLLYRHGIGIKTSYGKVFIPLGQLKSLDLEGGFDSTLLRKRTSTLYHHCPEIHDPITVPKWTAEIIAEYYPDKVLIASRGE